VTVRLKLAPRSTEPGALSETAGVATCNGRAAATVGAISGANRTAAKASHRMGPVGK